jgi:hypothetical protein
MEKNSFLERFGACFELESIRDGWVSFNYISEKLSEETIVDLSGELKTIEVIHKKTYRCDLVRLNENSVILAVEGNSSGINRLYRHLKIEFEPEMVIGLFKIDPLLIYRKLENREEVLRLHCIKISSKNVRVGIETEANVDVFNSKDALKATEGFLKDSTFKINKLVAKFRYKDESCLVSLTDSSKISFSENCKHLVIQSLA